MKTLRFWVYWRGGPVKLALRDGQSLSAGFYEPTDEGWNSEGSTWSRKGDEVTISANGDKARFRIRKADRGTFELAK